MTFLLYSLFSLTCIWSKSFSTGVKEKWNILWERYSVSHSILSQTYSYSIQEMFVGFFFWIFGNLVFNLFYFSSCLYLKVSYKEIQKGAVLYFYHCNPTHFQSINSEIQIFFSWNFIALKSVIFTIRFFKGWDFIMWLKFPLLHSFYQQKLFAIQKRILQVRLKHNCVSMNRRNP